MSKSKSKENPFSFFAYEKKKGDDIFGDSDDEDIFSDTSLSKTRSTTTKAPAPPTSKAASKTTDPENPFSFFKHTKEDVDMPPPPPKQPNNKSTETLFDSTDEEEDDDDWGTPVTKHTDTPPLPGAAFHNKSVSSPGWVKHRNVIVTFSVSEEPTQPAHLMPHWRSTREKASKPKL